MKPVAKKLSSVILSAAMIVSLTPFPGGLLMADETEPAAPQQTEQQTETQAEQETPAESAAAAAEPYRFFSSGCGRA